MACCKKKTNQINPKLLYLRLVYFLQFGLKVDLRLAHKMGLDSELPLRKMNSDIILASNPFPEYKTNTKEYLNLFNSGRFNCRLHSVTHFQQVPVVARHVY